MGNGISHHFQRVNSLRRSGRKQKEKTGNKDHPKNIEELKTSTATDVENRIPNMFDICLGELHKSVNRHDQMVEKYIKETSDQNRILNDVLHNLEEKVSKTETEELQDSSVTRLNEVIKDNVYKLKSMQKTCLDPLKESFKDVRNKIEKCEEEIKKSSTDVEDEIEHVKHSQEKVAKKEMTNKKLHQQDVNVRNVRKLKTIAVQIFHNHEGIIIEEIEKELKSTLINKLGSVSFTTCKKVSDIDPDKLLIVLCIVSTRLEADASGAIRDIQNPENTALLIIHCTETYSPPNQISSRHLTDSKFNHLRGIYDMSFMTRNGFLQCGPNERTINELCSVCQPTIYETRV